MIKINKDFSVRIEVEGEKAWHAKEMWIWSTSFLLFLFFCKFSIFYTMQVFYPKLLVHLMSAQTLVIIAIRERYDTRLPYHYFYKWHFNCSLIWNQLLSKLWKLHTHKFLNSFWQKLSDTSRPEVILMDETATDHVWSFIRDMSAHPNASSSLDLPMPRLFFPAVSLTRSVQHWPLWRPQRGKKTKKNSKKTKKRLKKN